MSTAFRPLEFLRASKLNAAIAEARQAGIDAAHDAGGAGSGSFAIAGKPLSDFGSIDPTGIANQATVINAGIAALSASATPLLINVPGTYRINSSILLRDKTHIICSPGVKIRGHFTSTTGMVIGDPALGFNTSTNPLHNVRIEGGDWARNGTISGANNEIWTGNTGNVFYFWCLDMHLHGVQVSGYSGGRAFLIAGSGLVDDCHVRNYDNFETSATPAAGGTGAFRVFGGYGLMLTRLTGVCGDDVFQFTPGSTPLDTIDCIYNTCWGISLMGRVCIAYLGSRAVADPSNSIVGCSFVNIRGDGVYGINSSNGESNGNLDVLFQNVVVGMRPAPPQSTHQNDSIGFDIGSGLETHTGTAVIRVRSCGLTNVTNAGMRVSGARAALVDIDGWVQPVPSNPASIRHPIQVQDAIHFRMNNFSVAAPPGLGKFPIVLGSTGEGTKLTLADLSNGTISGIDNAVNGIHGTLDGFVELNLDTVKFIPSPGATTAGAIRFSDITERAMIRNVDFRAVATPMSNAPATGVLFPNCRFATPTAFVQTLNVLPVIPWNGTSKFVRLVTTSTLVTVNTINFPVGFSFSDLPVIYITTANNFPAGFDNTGNIMPSGGAVSIGLQDVVGFLWDPVSVKWLQIAPPGVN